ncbi:von Willebrand factor A domain-containing protein 5B2 isoform X2 [Hemicordylus capensis]|uniref:von Willebrand factor A domain-containing protein 5B2 isoform X2 n=1 Tax=Hemicordylus capensis TaxID=884348 RepID=UPI0023038493|nr:von Willebrand factor A domain-containing protein 5B2 isoform X2 [Hemicordylus capensis]
MPGLYCLPAWTALPLQSSCVKACANGYSLGLTAHLTYINLEPEPVEGVFVYPLEESEVIASFEAVTGSRTSTFQIQNRPRVEDCCLDCNSSLPQPLHCSNGHLLLDEDLARSTFIISTGPVGPSETLTVVFSSSQELATRPNGALQVLFPSVLTPFVVSIPESESEARGLCDDSSTSCFGSSGVKNEHPFLIPPKDTDIFRGEVYNPFPYEFSFEMLVKGPCLLAGLESPSHALRADANPYANSASTICITLAERHRCDRNLEIILYPCEPHRPHLIIEEGAMTYQEYEAHIRNRRDYARIAKKDNDGERQVAFVQKRFHKDIFHNPVLMLNFCPEEGILPTDFQTVTREMLFLIDRSGSVNGPSIDGIKDALLVAVKSLPSSTLLNVAGFGSSIKPLFTASKPCNSETLRLACEHIRKLRADMGGTNLLAALTWLLGQPLHRGYPRQLFLFMHSGIGNTGKVIELVRRQASTVRCFTFGLGSGACRRLLRGLAKVSRGRAEFLSPGERLQPKLIKSLKRAIEPAVSDITIDWYVPDTMEALLSPNEIAALYPGDRLISYCTLYHIASFRDKKATGREQLCRSLSRSSAGSVFQSQDEAVGQEGAHPPPAGESEDIYRALHEISREISLEFSAGGTEESMKSGDPVSGGDIWKRIYQPSYIQEQYMLTHCSVSTDRSQGLLSHSSTSSESTGSRDVPPEGDSVAQTLESNSQQGQKSVSLCNSSTKSAPVAQAQQIAGAKVSVALSSEELVRRKKALARAALSGRSFSSPHGELDAHRLRRALEKVSQKWNRSLEGKLDEIGPEPQKMRKSIADSSNLLSPAHLDWDTLLEPPYLFSPSPAATERGECEGSAWPSLRCQVVIHALSAGKPVSWEVTATLDSLLLLATDSPPKEELPQQQPQNKVWDKLLHRLTAGSVIRDNENVAQREAELEHGFSRRFRLKAVQSSKACNTPSIYTSMVPVDSSTQETLPSALEVRSRGGLSSHQQESRSGSRRQRSYSAGLGQRQDSEELDDAPLSAEREEMPPASPVNLISASQEKPNCPDGADSNPSPVSMGSQKSMENFVGSRFSISRRRGQVLALRPQCLTPESELASCDSAIHDYLPLVRLQQAPGMFQLTESFSEVVQIPLDRLCRASPYTSHRASLSPASSTSPWALIAKSSPRPTASQPAPGGGEEGVGASKEAVMEPSSPHSHSTCSEVLSAAVWAQADSGRGSETDACDHSTDASEASLSLLEAGLEPEDGELESMSWATAVALAWLEHRCAGFFVEWELLAAKADAWLRVQQLPEGVDVAALKGAARQLFLLLRHWDENIKLNMLCYNPNNV